MDSTQLQILPLALIMVMGPQILTAIFLVTSHEPVKNSAAMLVGVLVAASVSVVIWFKLYDALGINPPSGSGPSTADYVVAGLLALLAGVGSQDRHLCMESSGSGRQPRDRVSAMSQENVEIVRSFR